MKKRGFLLSLIALIILAGCWYAAVRGEVVAKSNDDGYVVTIECHGRKDYVPVTGEVYDYVQIGWTCSFDQSEINLTSKYDVVVCDEQGE